MPIDRGSTLFSFPIPHHITGPRLGLRPTHGRGEHGHCKSHQTFRHSTSAQHTPTRYSDLRADWNSFETRDRPINNVLESNSLTNGFPYIHCRHACTTPSIDVSHHQKATQPVPPRYTFPGHSIGGTNILVIALPDSVPSIPSAYLPFSPTLDVGPWMTVCLPKTLPHLPLLNDQASTSAHPQLTHCHHRPNTSTSLTGLMLSVIAHNMGEIHPMAKT